MLIKYTIFLLATCNFVYFFLISLIHCLIHFCLAPYPLKNIAVKITSTSVNVSWNPPEQVTGPTNYIVTAKDNETKKQIGSCTTQG